MLTLLNTLKHDGIRNTIEIEPYTKHLEEE